MFKIDVKLKGVDEYCKDLKKELKSYRGVRVGYIGKESYPNGLTVAKNALIQEYGTERIPPRPFMRKAFKEKDQWANLFTKIWNRGIKSAFLNVGNAMTTSIVKSITSNIPPPNSAATIRRKGSSKTLIDTGLLMNSIHTELLKNGRS